MAFRLRDFPPIQAIILTGNPAVEPIIEDYFIKRSSSEKLTHEADGEAKLTNKDRA